MFLCLIIALLIIMLIWTGINYRRRRLAFRMSLTSVKSMSPMESKSSSKINHKISPLSSLLTKKLNGNSIQLSKNKSKSSSSSDKDSL
ncbi:hypothetical protein HUG17_6645 [Dermatophagoides farinae]|uniref:Uncharacterized protein n=1 Tax=Dermatophagoides farinae TaxID=6954 RepID=A0A9D4P551_DERFA|nr:hypothetical protein HUG17_6645 [Dermatophagoides farinae]